MDTEEGDNEEPLSLHKYLYASADPVDRVDPSGTEDFSMAGLAISMGVSGTLNAMATANRQSTLRSVATSFAIGAGEGAAFYVAGLGVGKLAQILAQTVRNAEIIGPAAIVRASQFASKLKAFEHYSKHCKGVVQRAGNLLLKTGGADLPEFSSLAEYTGAAEDFMSGPVRGDALQGIRSNGDIIRLDPISGYFGTKTRDGVIKTFFRPDGGPNAWVEYFLGQF